MRAQASAGQRPWQSLYFLPLPQKHGSLRPGVLSTRTGIIVSGSAATASGRRRRSRRRAPRAASRRRRPACAPEPCTGSSAELYFIRSVVGRPRRLLHRRDLEVRDVGDELVLDLAHHRLEHVEALTLPLGERVLLAHRPQVDALAEVVHLVEVLAPVLVDHREHHPALDLAEVVGADRRLLASRTARWRRR